MVEKCRLFKTHFGEFLKTQNKEKKDPVFVPRSQNKPVFCPMIHEQKTRLFFYG
jgi:hypothetical protein